MFDYLGVALLLVLVVLLAWLTRRAWRVRRKPIRWVGSVFAGLLTVVALVLLGAALLGYWKLNRSYPNPVPDLEIRVNPERLARGEKFAPFCSGCHAAEQGAPMTGQDFLGPDAPPIGRFYAPNLTPVHLGDWSDGEIARAIREGIHRNGRTLLIMPSRVLRHLGDEDLASIIAYLRSLPPQGERAPPNALNVLGAMLINIAPIIEAQAPIREPVETPIPGPNPTYGAYLASFTCAMCHGEDLMGSVNIPAPPITTVPLMWTEQEFIDFMRTGNKPGGIPVNAETMPWKELGRFLDEDDDLRAIYAHLEERAEALSSP